MMNIPQSLYGRRSPGPSQGGPGGGGGMSRFAQMNPSMMARLMRGRQPAPQAAPQAYGGPPAPQVPFQGAAPAQPAGPEAPAPGGAPPGGMPDTAMMGDALKKVFGGEEGLPNPGQQWGPGQTDPTADGGMDPKMMMTIAKMLPMLAGAPPAGI